MSVMSDKNNNIYLVILCILLLLTCLYGEKIDNGEELEGEGGFYSAEEPSDWVDNLFFLFIMLHHTYYAYKFTDYSLAHITSVAEEEETKKNEKKAKKKRKKELKNAGKKKKVKNGKKQKPNGPRKYKNGSKKGNNNDGNELEEAFKKRAKKKAEKEMKKLANSKNFTTRSNSNTKPKTMNNTLCCCIRCAPRYFTWQRTAMIRLFLRLFTSISCLLAMVLYMEFFMNLFVEFFITCVVHYDDGYIAALLLLPFLLYVVETLIRLSWHSVYVSWQINCDANGDFESVESDGSHHFNLQGDRFLYSYKMDAGDIEDEYNSSDFYDTEEDSSDSSSDSDDTDQSSSDGDDNDGLAQWNNVPSNSTKYRGVAGSTPTTPDSAGCMLLCLYFVYVFIFFCCDSRILKYV